MKNIKMDLIIEGLSKLDEDYSDLFKELEEDVIEYDELEMSNETPLDDGIDEAKTVTFGNSTYPKDGWAVIMAGGPGSGKGYVRKNKIAIDAKVIDVDRLKELYTLVAKRNKKTGTGKIRDDKEYDFKNPEDVGQLHDIVDKKDYKNKMEDAFFAGVTDKHKPNIIYDITGSKSKKLEKLGKMLNGMGYKVSLVWVLTNRQVALMRNLCRARVVPQNVFHDVTNQVNKNVFPFLQSEDAKWYDEAWVVFNSSTDLKELTPEEKKEFNAMSVVRFKKNGSSFEIPPDVMERVMKTLGPEETNVDSPEVYKSYTDIESDVSVFDKAKQGKTNLLKGDK